ncbi:unnamed protein product [Lasius platythorax]|uniref:Uncharacterized protein n=1 Tax=Lasius platythorax TaxID=488582 RepID=A0AAV2NZZ8_9HYME
MRFKVLQANVNHSRPSLDLLVHQARESGSGLLIVSEPNYIPHSVGWFASRDRYAAIYVHSQLIKMRCRLAMQGSRLSFSASLIHTHSCSSFCFTVYLLRVPSSNLDVNGGTMGGCWETPSLSHYRTRPSLVTLNKLA